MNREAQSEAVVATLIFTNKRVGKKYRRYVDVARFYLGSLVSPRTKPIFESRVSRDIIVNAMRELRIEFSSHRDQVITVHKSSDLHKLVFFTGVRQFIGDPFKASEFIELAKAIGDLEALFWYTKFIVAYEKYGYWGVYRVAKSIRTLYRLY